MREAESIEGGSCLSMRRAAASHYKGRGATDGWSSGAQRLQAALESLLQQYRRGSGRCTCQETWAPRLEPTLANGRRGR